VSTASGSEYGYRIGQALRDDEENVELTRSTLFGTASSIGLLNSEASTEGTGNSIVTAADSADVSGRGTEAVELVGHLDVDDKVLLLGLGETERTGDVVGHLQGGEGGDGIASLIHVALERTGTISVDLMDGDSQHGATRNLSHTTSCKLVLGLFANVDVAGNLCSSACVDDVGRDFRVTDDGSILLARGDSGAVASNSRVDQETLTLARVSNSGQDSCVRVHGGEKSGKRNGRSSEVHDDWSLNKVGAQR
jgi:hypothetical protein